MSGGELQMIAISRALLGSPGIVLLDEPSQGLAPKIVQEYREHQMIPEEDRPKQDFEKPVETQTPEPTPEPEQIARQETRPEEPQAPKQPIPVAEPVPTSPDSIRGDRTPQRIGAL